jgi:Flp pilus assembly pilin Flp
MSYGFTGDPMTVLHTISRTLRRFRDDEDGLALIEFAFVLPIMLLLLGVTIEGARMMWAYQAATAGVRDAARYVAMVADADLCASTPYREALEDEMQARLDAMEARRATFDGGTTVDDVTLDCIDIADTERPNPATAVDFDLVRLTAVITIDFPFGSLFGLVSERALTGFTTEIHDEHRVFGQ